MGKADTSMPQSPHVASTTESTTPTTKTTVKRPLRTYSKRDQPDRDVEPIAKKRRVEEKEKKPQEQPPVVEVQAPKLSPPPQKHSTSARGPSIRDYFRPVPSSSSSRTSIQKLSSDINQPASSPPSSPPVLATKRSQKPILVTKNDGDSSPPQDFARGDEEVVEEAEETSDMEGSNVSGAEEGGLRECSNDILNRRLPLGRNRDKPRKRPKEPKKKKKKAEQTTLSLTMDANFTECKECNVLYNPYHAEDAKIHARRHAAIMKRKNKA